MSELRQQQVTDAVTMAAKALGHLSAAIIGGPEAVAILTGVILRIDHKVKDQWDGRSDM
jgi:hypothetical protein